MVLFLSALLVLVTSGSCGAELTVSPESGIVLVNQSTSFNVTLNNATQGAFNITIKVNDEGKSKVYPDVVHDVSNIIQITGLTAASSLLVNITSSEGEVAYYSLTVEKSSDWATFSLVIGWIYFAAWSVSFYPQLYDNWKRKSVVGLNLDFLALNLVGFFLYSMFNAFMFWDEGIQDLYAAQHPGAGNAVMANDVGFSLHALIAVILTIIQCFIYERGGQIVSMAARGLIGVFAVVLVICSIIAGVGVEGFTWLTFLQVCSYIKLVITLVKYIPQAYMNYSRKSTVGWSIGNVLLDFTGGMLSMLQMIVNSWNYDDWASIFGDPTKFGLGLFSVVFDIFFLLQHYVWYRNNYADITGSTISTSRSDLVT